MLRYALALAPALLMIAPSSAGAATDTYEALRAPAGKTVVMWRHVNRPATTLVTCPPDSTKSPFCHGRKVEAEAAARKAQQLSQN